MSADTIPARSNGQTIDETWFNLLRTVLGVDAIPRNASGVATEVAGSLGSSTYPWLKLFFGAAASALTLEESSGKIRLKIGTNNYLEISTTGMSLVSGGVTIFSTNSSGITRPYLASVGQQISSSCGTFTTTSASYVDVTNLSVTLTTVGRPVLISLQSAGASFMQHSNTAQSGLKLSGTTLTAPEWLRNSVNGLTMDLLPLVFLDLPAAGSQTYKVQAKINSGVTLTLDSAKLVAFEL